MDDKDLSIGTIRLESRYSSKAAQKLVNSLSEKQRQVVKDIGFEPLLRIPYGTKSDRQMHTWLLSCLNTTTMVLEIDDHLQIPVRPEDVQCILGIPMGHKLVTGSDEIDRTMATAAFRNIFNLPKGANLMSTIGYEKIIERTSACETDNDKDRFICAFVGAMVGNILAPTGRYDKLHSEILPAIACPQRTSEFNWCAYVVEEIRNSAIKAQKAIQSGQPTITIHGCVLFLQVLFMESLPILKQNVPQDIFPRAAAYRNSVMMTFRSLDESHTRVSIYKQFLQSLANRHNVCKANRLHKTRQCEDIVNLFERCVNPNITANIGPSQQPQFHQTFVSQDSIHGANTLYQADNEHQDSLHHTQLTTANHLTFQPIQTNGDIAAHFHDVHDFPATFADQGNQSIEANQLLLRVGVCQDETHTSNIDAAPVAHAGNGNNNNEITIDESSASSDGTQSNMDFMLIYTGPRTVNEHSQVEHSEPNTLSLLDEELVRCHDMIRRSDDISQWIESTKWHHDYFRTWISHDEHKSVSLSGLEIKSSLFDTLTIDRRICELAMRSFKYMEIVQSVNVTTPVQRHFISTDWADYVICGVQPSCKECYMDLFKGRHISYDVAKCRMVISLVSIGDAWCCYCWDLATRRLSILDPVMGDTNEEIIFTKHIKIAPALLGSLLKCLEIYCNRQCDSISKWDILLARKFTDTPQTEKSGLQSLFCATEFNGVHLQNSLTQRIF
ncbi:hypothetical protein ACP70R_000561 [Stipagrostis hirtigluma subsp. patula]